MKELPKDAWSRSKAVLGLVAGLSGQELRHRVRAGLSGSVEKLRASELTARVEQARLMVASLGRLKGALMKAGQLLSIDASDVLPPEAVAILAQLQAGAEPVEFETLRGVLVEELGADWARAFDSFDTRPAASASIGQVHRATFEGVAVAVKIQYPAVRESIDSDLDVLQKLGNGFLTVSRSKIDLAGVFEELRSTLHREADYRHELGSQLRFAQLVEHDATFVVPRSFPQLSTTRVHTMTWEEGQPLGQWLQGNPQKADRLWLAQLLLELYCLEFFRWGLVQTDPNFGNFLVRSQARQLVLLDFGATLEFEREFRQGYVQLLRVVASGDTRRIGEAGVTFGLIDPRESRATLDLFAQFLAVASEPFAPSRQPFQFRDAGYAERSQDIGRRFVRSLEFSPPPRRLLFLHRKLGGIFQLLKRLDVELDLRPYWERLVQSSD
ncbi:MAG TPA: AarF/ABC1/UbiB kinase family protein [Polyangiaceae bacterium]|nr:AarF/ABC1/UbiB kinase family protein [Polyangiaceae bacterium]